MSLKNNKFKPTRRQILAGAAAATAIPLRLGVSKLTMRPKVILELTRNAATNSMRAVEKVIWVAK